MPALGLALGLPFGRAVSSGPLSRATARWDASLLTGSDNDLVATFTEQVEGNHGTASGSARGTLKVAARNGLNILRFDGVANTYGLTATINGAGPWTIAAVLKASGVGMPVLSTLEAQYFAGVGRFAVDSVEIGDKAVWQLGTTGTPTGSWEVVIFSHTGAISGASGMINGVQIPMGPNTGPSPGLSGGDFGVIGQFGTSGILGNGGDMGELAYWPEVLGDDDKLAVTAELQTKWGIA